MLPQIAIPRDSQKESGLDFNSCSSPLFSFIPTPLPYFTNTQTNIVIYPDLEHIIGFVKEPLYSNP